MNERITKFNVFPSLSQFWDIISGFRNNFLFQQDSRCKGAFFLGSTLSPHSLCHQQNKSDQKNMKILMKWPYRGFRYFHLCSPGVLTDTL